MTAQSTFFVKWLHEGPVTVCLKQPRSHMADLGLPQSPLWWVTPKQLRWDAPDFCHPKAVVLTYKRNLLGSKEWRGLPILSYGICNYEGLALESYNVGAGQNHSNQAKKSRSKCKYILNSIDITPLLEGAVLGIVRWAQRSTGLSRLESSASHIALCAFKTRCFLWMLCTITLCTSSNNAILWFKFTQKLI